jgi:hypothetical protein
MVPGLLNFNWYLLLPATRFYLKRLITQMTSSKFVFGREKGRMLMPGVATRQVWKRWLHVSVTIQY